ncbi:hypothetical protein SLA2020_254290 [Shorea laevis]
MATTPTNRAERRRKIVERGSDRLALITGRIHNLPSSPSSPLDHHDLFSRDQQAPRSYLNVGELGEASRSSLFLRRQASYEAPKESTFDVGVKTEPSKVLNKSESVKEIISVPSDGEVRTRLQPLKVKTEIQKVSHDPKPIEKTIKHQPRLFSSQRLNHCIIASEGLRSFCAFLLALMVVLSYISYPLFGGNIANSESVVASRPVYILLLTDITIVLARMYVDKQGDFEEVEEEKVVQNDGDNWTDAVKLMERGLVFYQTIRALFIDFSIYSVVVICGLSFI